jgi:hypothetical protein
VPAPSNASASASIPSSGDASVPLRYKLKIRGA